MHPLLVHTRVEVPPRGVQDLTVDDGLVAGRDSLVAAGQALTWRSRFTSGSRTAIPLSATCAVVVAREEPAREDWHDRLIRGLAHRLAGELTIATFCAGGRDVSAPEEAAEDAELLASAIDGLGRLLADLEDTQTPEETADRIVADAVGTHLALVGAVADQQVTVRHGAEFTVHSVRSVSADMTRSDLEEARSRIGLPWPAQAGTSVGEELGLARWCIAMQLRGHQMWCRLEGDDALVTDLWLRHL
ncbi:MULTISPECIES: hypothetical protein [Thermomonosporaceae]|uniref:hypothetical protein n=1 Tax=Thermomonosporaceae TaxID=2012 RepID=UPI00255AD566|nr:MULTISPECIES: hypothetical protein [Thermomonosporaceae]MDL4772966.1 hypothetical protein [Actinomadura xylanilytica]